VLSRSLGGKCTGKHVLVKGFSAHLLLVPHFCAKQCVAFEHQGCLACSLQGFTPHFEVEMPGSCVLPFGEDWPTKQKCCALNCMAAHPQR
jgi:hypothetical protein